MSVKIGVGGIEGEVEERFGEGRPVVRVAGVVVGWDDLRSSRFGKSLGTSTASATP
jgi:hypothetical protein